jgi:hypothetical protein
MLDPRAALDEFANDLFEFLHAEGAEAGIGRIRERHVFIVKDICGKTMKATTYRDRTVIQTKSGRGTCFISS